VNILDFFDFYPKIFQVENLPVKQIMKNSGPGNPLVYTDHQPEYSWIPFREAA
jgi:hypothetical protein